MPPATITPRPNLPCHQRHRPTLSIPPCTCVQTTSTTEGSRISCWWIGTQTDRSSPDPRIEQMVSVESYEILSPPMASQMAAQSLPRTPPRISYPHGVFHRMSSAYNPHANCRAETAVKTTKRLIAGNTGPGGTLSDNFHQALLQYRNGQSPGTGMSPAQCLFGRATRDILPGLPATYRPH